MTSTELDQFHHLGARLRCVTCLGTEIIGTLVAYQMDQKLMLLKVEQFNEIDDDGGVENNSTKPEANQFGEMGEEGSKLERTNSQDKDKVDDSTKHDFTLVNIRYISCLEELTGGTDIDKTLKEGLEAAAAAGQTNCENGDVDMTNAAAATTTTEETAQTGPATKKSKKSAKKEKSNTSSKENTPLPTTNTGSEDPTRKSLIEAGLYPAFELDMPKLKEKLTDNMANKMRKAKLTKLGVNQNGFDLMAYLGRTLGAQETTLKWDRSGNIAIFEEVRIEAPYFDVEHTVACGQETNLQTLDYIRRKVEAFHKEKGEAEGVKGK